MEMQQELPGDLGEYPRTYGVNRALGFIRGIAVSLLMIALVGIVGQSAGVIHRSVSPAGLVLLGVSFGGIAIAMWLGIDRRVTIEPNSIQVTGWAGARMLRREKILGYRIGRAGRFREKPFYILVPVDRSEGELKMPPYLKTDGLFQDWMNSIPRVND